MKSETLLTLTTYCSATDCPPQAVGRRLDCAPCVVDLEPETPEPVAPGELSYDSERTAMTFSACQEYPPRQPRCHDCRIHKKEAQPDAQPVVRSLHKDSSTRARAP